MRDQEAFIAGIVGRLKRMHGGQGELDTLYSDLMEGFKEVHSGDKKQVWFSKELEALRKEVHRTEKQWLERKASEEQKHLRIEYLKARAAYSKAVLSSNVVNSWKEIWGVPKVLEGLEEDELWEGEEAES